MIRGKLASPSPGDGTSGAGAASAWVGFRSAARADIALIDNCGASLGAAGDAILIGPEFFSEFATSGAATSVTVCCCTTGAEAAVEYSELRLGGRLGRPLHDVRQGRHDLWRFGGRGRLDQRLPRMRNVHGQREDRLPRMKRICSGCVCRFRCVLRLARRGSAPWPRLAGSEIGGKSCGGPYQVNSICTGASVGFVSGRDPQIGRIRIQMMATCHSTEASIERPGDRRANPLDAQGPARGR